MDMFHFFATETSDMWKRKVLFAAVTAASLWTALPASAQIYIDVAPPAPRYEVVPAPRAGFVWQPGYYEYRHHQHVWHNGYWVKERRGMYWHPSRWEQENGRYVFRQGVWDREKYVYHDNGRHYGNGDRDRDGVPNRVDRDRDGDGVPNRYDAAPDNPRRQ
jgi:hypothetical protein